MLFAGPQGRRRFDQTRHRANPRQEFARSHRFEEILIRARRQTIHRLPGADGLARNQNDKHIAQGGVPFDLPADLNAADVGQNDVQHHQIRPVIANHPQGQPAIASREDFVTRVLQELGIKPQKGQIVIHHENAGPGMDALVERAWAAGDVCLCGSSHVVSHGHCQRTISIHRGQTTAPEIKPKPGEFARCILECGGLPPLSERGPGFPRTKVG